MQLLITKPIAESYIAQYSRPKFMEPPDRWGYNYHDGDPKSFDSRLFTKKDLLCLKQVANDHYERGPRTKAGPKADERLRRRSAGAREGWRCR